MKARLVPVAEIRKGCRNGHALCLRAACYLEPDESRKAEKLTVTIRLENAAFHPEEGSEVARILRKLAAEFEGTYLSPGNSVTLFDVNGNAVGKAEVR